MKKRTFVLIFLGVEFLLTSSCRLNEAIVEVAQNERGVLFRSFANGIDTSRVYLPGEYQVKSFDRFIKYNIDSRTESSYFESKAVSGKKISLLLNYSYRIVPEKVALMEYYVGSNYPKSIVETRIQTTVDEFTNEIINTVIDKSSQKYMEETLHSIARAKIIKRYVDLYDFKILKLTIE